MVLVRQVQRLREGEGYAVDVGLEVEVGEVRRERRVGREELVWPAFGAVKVRGGLGVAEDFRLEEFVVGFAGLFGVLWTLRMQLQGCLEKLERLVDVELPGRVDFVDDVLLGLDIDGCERRLLLVS